LATVKTANEASDQASLIAFSDSLPVMLMRARESVMSRLRPVLRAHGFTEQQWRVLRTLNAVEEIEVTLLAERVFLIPSSLSRILSDLHDRGLVQRRRPAEDMRRGLISISPQGRAAIEEATPDLAREQAEIARLYGDARLGLLRGLLHELELTIGPPSAAPE
jgi:homoprotocatechuate degradation regulator HpaR